MPLPQRDPYPSAIEFARERLAESWEPFAQRLDTLDGLQRSVALWLIAAEALALFEYRLEEKIDGLRLLAFGVDSFDLSDASLQITAYVMPTALDANLSRVLPQIAVRDEAGEVEYIDVVPEPWDLTLHQLNL